MRIGPTGISVWFEPMPAQATIWSAMLPHTVVVVTAVASPEAVSPVSSEAHPVTPSATATINAAVVRVLTAAV